ncbi:MAG TPA: hypothetical protein PKM88_16655 [bacterium]|nr:hypothetical protein [bacterium]
MTYHLLAVKVTQRVQTAKRVQELLTEHGCGIKVRLGIHDQPANACSPDGLIVLQLTDAQAGGALAAALNREDGVTAQFLSL